VRSQRQGPKTSVGWDQQSADADAEFPPIYITRGGQPVRRHHLAREAL